MYRIYIDGNLAYSPYEKEFAVYDAKLSVEQNQPDTFEFTLPFTNPFVNSIEKMCTEVRMLRDDELMFVGVACEDTLNFDNSRTVKCKGDLYFLSQSIIRPYSFQGSVKDYFKLLIDAHNAESERKFYVGSVTVTDPNDYITRASSDYPTVFKEITDKCIGIMGGYLVIRYVDGKRYIDYLDDYTTVNEQTVEFAMNISDVNVDSDVLELATVLIPRGANIESGGTEEDQQSAEKRIDITSVNDGKDYIQDDESVARYGRIMKVETWDDVTLPENLLKKAKKKLKELSSMTKVITLKAVDVSAVRNVSPFSLHQYIHVISKPNGIDDLYLPTKIDMNIFSPESNSIELTVSSMTKNETNARRTVHGSFIDTTGSVENNTFDKLNRIVDDYSSRIWQEKNIISAEVAESVSRKARVTMAPNAPTNPNIGDLWINTDGNVMSFYSGIEWIDATNEGLEKFINTTFRTYVEQTSKQLSFVIESYTSRIDSVENSLTEQLKPVRTYFTMKDDGLHIAKSGSSSEIVYGNDKISLCESGQEIAYIKQHKMYITDIEVTNSLRIGNYAFSPRKNGSVDFKLYKKEGTS